MKTSLHRHHRCTDITWYSTIFHKISGKLSACANSRYQALLSRAGRAWELGYEETCYECLTNTDTSVIFVCKMCLWYAVTCMGITFLAFLIMHIQILPPLVDHIYIRLDTAQSLPQTTRNAKKCLFRRNLRIWEVKDCPCRLAATTSCLERLGGVGGLAGKAGDRQS